MFSFLGRKISAAADREGSSVAKAGHREGKKVLSIAQLIKQAEEKKEKVRRRKRR